METKTKILIGAIVLILVGMLTTAIIDSKKPSPDFVVYTIVTTKNDTLNFQLPYENKIGYENGDSIKNIIIPRSLSTPYKFVDINFKNGEIFGSLQISGDTLKTDIISGKIIAVDSGYREYIPRLTK